MYEPITPQKAPGVKAPVPFPEEPAAKQPKLQELDERYRAELQMQVEGEPELPAFEKRIALFGAGPPQEPPVLPQKRPPSQSPLMPRKPLVTGKEKPWFTKVFFSCIYFYMVWCHAIALLKFMSLNMVYFSSFS